MTIQPIGAASVALYLTPADLSQYGITPAALTLKQALFLTRQACQGAGIDLEGSVEIEAYPECCGVLVFARVRPTGTLWFTFPDIEPVLGAALALRDTDTEASLWWWEGQYWLSLPAEDSRGAAVCCEFGSPQPADPLLPARLEECGQAIFPHHAFRHLCHHFLSLQM